jgi:cell division protein FtsB
MIAVVRALRHRAVVASAMTIAVVSVLFLGVFPTRSILAQRADIDAAREELGAIESGNLELQDRIDDLRTDAEVERIAREQYNLVFPGEEAYLLLPPPAPPVPVPDAWPFRALRAAVLGDVGNG